MVYLLFFISFFLKIKTELPKCKNNSIKYIITKCNENLKRSIYFSNPEKCNIFSLSIPYSNENIECKECENGYYLKYDFTTKNLKCEICPKNTFSIKGNFRINGEYLEWNKETIDSFQNDCFINDINNDNYYCTSFYTETGKKLMSGNPYFPINNNINFTVQLGKTFHLIENGQLKFKYKKDTIKNEENKKNGIFKFFINYIIFFIDDEISSSKNEYKNIVIDLKPGYYTFLWQYSKEINISLFENLKYVIKNIEITGIQNAALECISCKNGFSNEGSDHCEICSKGLYFDNISLSCKKCPLNSISYGGIGIKSCISLPNCNEDDYIKILNNLCVNNKQKIDYKLINDKCNEINKKDDIFINCLKCEKGFYKNNVDKNIYKCDYCPPYTYSNNENMDNCLFCEGILKKKMVFNYIENNLFNEKIEIIEEEGELMIEIDNTGIQTFNSITIIIDNNNISKEQINNTIQIKLEKGIHNIYINSINIFIKKITILNTSEGGGYECKECSDNIKVKTENGYTCLNCGPGYYFNSEQKCVKCDEGYIKINSGNHENCIKCPSFTYSNDERNQCFIYDVLNQKNIMRSFIIDELENTNEKLCKMQTCIDSFLPVKDNNKRDLYYISFKYSKIFSYENPKYSFNDSKKKSQPGFIFLLQDNNDDGKIFNIGNQIESIKILDENDNKGIIIEYIGSDMCTHIKDIKIKTYLFLKCKKNEIENNIFTYQNPVFVNYKQCSYYFEWETSFACPICLSNEVNQITSFCKNSKRDIFVSENQKCIIQNPKKKLGNDIEYDSNDNIINENDIELIKIYKLNINSKRIYPNKNTKYIYEKKYINSCSMSSNYDTFSIIYIIIGIIVYIILLIIICIFYFKSNKLRANFSGINVVKIKDREIK